MKRTLLSAAALLTVAIAAATQAGALPSPPGAQSQPGALASQPGARSSQPGALASQPGAPPARLADRDWVVRSVSPGGRVLVLETLGGPCGHDPRATVTERDASVTIRVQERAPVDLSAVRCAAPESERLRVHLSKPIAGRKLPGQSLLAADPGAGRVPRVVGLRAADARFALRAQGFRPAGDFSGTVVAQRPRATTDGTTVRLTTMLLCGGAPFPA